MPLRNLFVRTTNPYYRISKEYSECDANQSENLPLALPEEIGHLVMEQAHRQSKHKHVICYALLCLVSFITGIILSQFFRLEFEADGYPPPFGRDSHILKDVAWNRNETFQAPPSAVSEKAWMELMPKGRGGIRYPKDNPVERGMTVFHGIHCLYNIHTGFHANAYRLAKLHQSILARSLHDGPPSHSPPASPIFFARRSSSPNDHPLVPSKPFTSNPYLDAKLANSTFLSFLEGDHLAHCFDYLRQSLMCSADSTLEEGVKNGEDVEITGWGTKRVCRDFESVRKWAEDWRGEEGVGLN